MVRSRSGEGTTFDMYLPALHSTAMSEIEAEENGLVANGLQIMVMDDDEMILTVAEAQLAALGHEPVLVIDGDQAVSRYKELQELGTPPDLVILDLTIPGGMGGQEAAAALLAVDPAAKIIVASGYSNDPVMAEYEKYGFCAAIAKPFDLKGLGDVISSVF